MNKDIRKIIYRNSDLYRLHRVKLADALKEDQIGGGNKLTITYNGNEYIFEKSIVDDNHYILSSKMNDDCVSIIISSNGLTEIHGIGNYDTCLIDTNQNVGSHLLKLTLKMFKKYKNKFNIKMITLTDNSLKKCGKHDIKLAQMLTLLTGDTWYGKYGFRPIKYDNNTFVIDNHDNKNYEKNKTIMNHLRIKDIKLLNYIKLTENDKIIKATEKIINEAPKMLLKDYLSNFLSNYDKSCDNFNKFYRKLYEDIGLTNFHKQQFGLILE